MYRKNKKNDWSSEVGLGGETARNQIRHSGRRGGDGRRIWYVPVQAAALRSVGKVWNRAGEEDAGAPCFQQLDEWVAEVPVIRMAGVVVGAGAGARAGVGGVVSALHERGDRACAAGDVEPKGRGHRGEVRGIQMDEARNAAGWIARDLIGALRRPPGVGPRHAGKGKFQRGGGREAERAVERAQLQRRGLGGRNADRHAARRRPTPTLKPMDGWGALFGFGLGFWRGTGGADDGTYIEIEIERKGVFGRGGGAGRVAAAVS